MGLYVGLSQMAGSTCSKHFSYRDLGHRMENSAAAFFAPRLSSLYTFCRCLKSNTVIPFKL